VSPNCFVTGAMRSSNRAPSANSNDLGESAIGNPVVVVGK